MKQHHFVVMFDEATGQFDMDYQTQDAVFNGKPIFDTENEDWQPVGDDLDDNESFYCVAADLIAEAIAQLPVLGA
jgi:hypothetical protein